MEFFKEWTLCICISLVGAAILSLFAPQGRMNRFYKTVIALFVFVSFLYPLKSLHKPDFDFSYSFPSAAAQEQGSAAYETMLNEQIKDTFLENGIEGAAVSSSVHYDYAAGEIRVNSIQAAIPDEYDTATAEALILQKLGLHIKVIHLGE